MEVSNKDFIELLGLATEISLPAKTPENDDLSIQLHPLFHGKSPKGRPSTSPVAPAPKSDSDGGSRPSSARTEREVLVRLREKLDKSLEQMQIKKIGICPVRRMLYSQCFDELIRQVTINCKERGSLLVRVRDEIQLTIEQCETLNESSLAFSLRKALQAEQDEADMGKRVSELYNENQDLIKQLNKQKMKNEAIEIERTEKRQIWKEIHDVKEQMRTVQQLRAQLEMMKQ